MIRPLEHDTPDGAMEVLEAMYADAQELTESELDRLWIEEQSRRDESGYFDWFNFVCNAAGLPLVNTTRNEQRKVG